MQSRLMLLQVLRAAKRDRAFAGAPATIYRTVALSTFGHIPHSRSSRGTPRGRRSRTSDRPLRKIVAGYGRRDLPHLPPANPYKQDIALSRHVHHRPTLIGTEKMTGV
jgi:hypothetical protein